jgi:hypothetical protein
MTGIPPSEATSAPKIAPLSVIFVATGLAKVGNAFASAIKDIIVNRSANDCHCAKSRTQEVSFGQKGIPPSGHTGKRFIW